MKKQKRKKGKVDKVKKGNQAAIEVFKKIITQIKRGQIEVTRMFYRDTGAPPSFSYIPREIEIEANFIYLEAPQKKKAKNKKVTKR